MASEHTAEPWAATRTKIMGGTSCEVVLARVNRWLVQISPGVLGIDGRTARANARRIVACVNACRGIPTEVLETFGTPTALIREMAKASGLKADSVPEE